MRADAGPGAASGAGRLLVLLLVLFGGGYALRRGLGLELSAEGLHAWVAGLGWIAPAGFVTLLALRQFVLIPSALLLTVGGLVFGTAGGTALGGLGVFLSACLQFGIAVALGREWLAPRYGAAMDELERRVATAGPLLVGGATAHPTGPMTAVHWAAGLARVSPFAFVLTVAIAAPIRAGLCAAFGATLLEPGSLRFWVTTAVLAVLLLLPLAHPGVRRGLGELMDGAGGGRGRPRP